MSLREAVSQANTDAAAGVSDTITFAASLAGSTITLTQGQIELNGAGAGVIAIDGSGLSSTLTISGNNSSRIFQVEGGVQAVFTDINLSHGNDGGQLFGGALYNNGNLTLNNVVISDSTAQYGGGVSNNNTLVINGGTFEGDSSGAGYGGGLFNSGTATATGTIFTSNTSSGSGGAVLNFLGGSSFSLSGCTFTGNSAANGGAVDLDNCAASTLDSCSFNSNTASQTGGAVTDSGSMLTISSCTFSGDTATQDGSSINANSGTIIIQGPGWSNSETIAADNGGTLDLYDNWTNSGTIKVDAASAIALGSPVDVTPGSSAASAYIWKNTGTITIADGATVYLGSVVTTDQYLSGLQAFGVTANLVHDNVYVSGTLDNSEADNPISGGVLTLNSSIGGLTVSGEIYQGASAGTIQVEGVPLTIEGTWSNEDTIAATGGATLNLYGKWSNAGAISVDASSTIGLGSPVAIDPTSSSAANYAWTNSGQIIIANGAIVYLGGVFTTDTFNNDFKAQGVSVQLAQDVDYLSGTLDNSAADNPQSAGTVSLGSLTGSLRLSGGEIYHGTVATNGNDILIGTSAGGTLDSVTLGGVFDLSQAAGASATALNSFVNQGVIELGENTFNVTGDYTQTSSGILDVAVASGGQYGQVAISGKATLAGAMNLSFLNGYVSQSSDAYEVLSFSQAVGAFDATNGLGPYPNGVYLAPVYNAANLTLQATISTPIYWTGDAGDDDWDNPANWSLVDPLVSNTPQSVLPGAGNAVPLSGSRNQAIQPSEPWLSVRPMELTPCRSCPTGPMICRSFSTAT